MAEFSLKDTLIGGGLLFGIGVFLKSKQGKKKVNLDYDNWGGNPDGKLAKALAKAREESKKPREPLKIERLDAETEDSPPIEYSAYGRRINYLEMIYNAFYDPESSIYQVVNGNSSGAISYGEGFILPETAIFFDLRNGSSQLDGQRLSFMYGGNRGSRNKLKTNVKNALQRASGTKLSSSGRLHHGGLIGADYEYNGKMFFIRYNMRGRGNSRRTTLSVASQDSIPEYRRGEYPFSRAYEHENDYKYQGNAEGLTNRQLGQLRRREREREERERESQELQEKMDRKRRERNESYLQKLENRGLTLSQKKIDADVGWKHDALMESRSWFVPLRERMEQKDEKMATQALIEAYLLMQDSYYYGGFNTRYYHDDILLDMEILLEEYFNQEEYQ